MKKILLIISVLTLVFGLSVAYALDCPVTGKDDVQRFRTDVYVFDPGVPLTGVQPGNYCFTLTFLVLDNDDSSGWENTGEFADVITFVALINGQEVGTVAYNDMKGYDVELVRTFDFTVPTAGTLVITTVTKNSSAGEWWTVSEAKLEMR